MSTAHSHMFPSIYLCVLRARQRGFTMIELMVVVVIVAVLAATALPAFAAQLRKSRRADAVAVLTQVMQAQERWRVFESAYAGDFGTGVLNVRSTAARDVAELRETHYTITIPDYSASGYRVRAVASGAQAADAQCAVMEVRSVGGNFIYVSAARGSDIDSATGDANKCWYR